MSDVLRPQTAVKSGGWKGLAIQPVVILLILAA